MPVLFPPSRLGSPVNAAPAVVGSVPVSRNSAALDWRHDDPHRDDDPTIRFILRKFTEQFRPGEEIVAVEDGLAALARCAEASLLIADVMMPDMDGITLVKAVREAGHTYPIIVISANPQREAEAIDADATAFVSKGQLFTALPRLLRA
jgi:CheY-like chemotaxis protein